MLGSAADAEDVVQDAWLRWAAATGVRDPRSWLVRVVTHLGVDRARIEDVPRWRDSTVYTATERLVMEFAEAATATPPTVGDDLVASLRRGLGNAGVVELAALVALENHRSRFNAALGLTSQGFAAECAVRPAGS